MCGNGDYYDNNNNLINRPYSLNYNNIYNCNIVATQELDKKVIEQEKIINDLSNEIIVLKNKLNIILRRLDIS